MRGGKQWRLCSSGDGAWIDHDFGTIDVFVVMPVEAIAARYSDRFAGVRIAA